VAHTFRLLGGATVLGGWNAAVAKVPPWGTVRRHAVSDGQSLRFVMFDEADFDKFKKAISMELPSVQFQGDSEDELVEQVGEQSI